MTGQITALRALEKAIEAGTLPEAIFTGLRGEKGHWAYETGISSDRRIWVEKAYNGSLDAALALHDALLPGWIGSIDTDGFARVYWPGPVITVMETVRIDGQPARAWLLAVIRAQISKDE